MGNLIRFYFDNPTILTLAITGGGDAALPSDMPTDQSVLCNACELAIAGIQGQSSEPSAARLAFEGACRIYCEFVGEIDHFRYDDEDLSELFSLQFGDTSTQLSLLVDQESGLPAVNHWPFEDLQDLEDRLKSCPLNDRPEYTHDVFTCLSLWVAHARQRECGLIVFTE